MASFNIEGFVGKAFVVEGAGGWHGRAKDTPSSLGALVLGGIYNACPMASFASETAFKPTRFALEFGLQCPQGSTS